MEKSKARRMDSRSTHRRTDTSSISPSRTRRRGRRREDCPRIGRVYAEEETKMEQGRDTNFLTRRNEELALDLEYNDINEAEDTEDDTENEDEQPPNSVLLREDEDEFDDDFKEEEQEEEQEQQEEEEEAKAKVTVNGTHVRLNSREVNGVKESVACLL